MTTMVETKPAINNPLEHLLGYHLRRASVAMMADLSRRLVDLGLTLTEISVLQLIEANPLITQSEIGRAISIKRANIAPIAAGLLARDLVEREAMDGRSQGLMLTGTGAALLGQARACMDQNEDLFLARISEDDRLRLLNSLRSMWSQLDEADKQTD